MIAAAVCLYSCGPSASVNRAELTTDARPVNPERTDAPVNPPGGPGPFQPPSNPPPSGPPGPPIDVNRSPDGFPCKANNECLSFHCADNVCCSAACDGVCQACDQPGNAGRCLPVPGDQDPDEECAEEAPETCGRDGACDGAGACRLRPAGAVCAPGGCEIATERSARLCDGKGTCSPTTHEGLRPRGCASVTPAPRLA